MKKVSLLCFLLSMFFLWSCGGNTRSDNEAEVADHSEHVDHADHHYNESSDPLTLNDGERWLVNEEMKPFVSEGAALVDDFLQSNDSKGQGDFVALADSLREQNQLLIQNCTMTGQSHDELHKWLHPHMALVEELAGAESEEEAKDWALKLKDSYDQYHHFFQ